MKAVRMNFRDVVICDNPTCGAILRISDKPGPIAVSLRRGPFGSFVLCPRCAHSTLIDIGTDVPAAAAATRAHQPAAE